MGMRSFTLYCRVAAHPRFRDGYRITASQQQTHEPLRAGAPPDDVPVRTAFFKLRIKVPVSALLPTMLPEAETDVPEEVLEIEAEAHE